MPVIRNKLASVRSGGPRQFTQLRNKFIIQIDEQEDALQEVRSELDNIGLVADPLENLPGAVVEPRGQIDTVLEILKARQRRRASNIQDGIDDIQDAREQSENIIEATTGVVAATRALVNEMSGLPRINIVDFAKTYADYGPENLRMSPFDMPTLGPQEAKEKENNIDDVYEQLGIKEAHQENRGENAIVAIFDTAFAEDLIDKSRIVGTYHGDDVDSVYKSSEGHGTMCAGAAAANSDEGVPFDGAAPEAGVVLVRTTDSEGQISGDIITQAWDWLTGLDVDRPIVSNHSYGTPLCSGRPRTQFCESAQNSLIARATDRADIVGVYAAGNEAMQCGHRPSGVTNAITGTNSIEDVVTVGALLSNSREAQRYSSHGRGDCAPIADPKPNVSCPIPMHTYYGGEDGWKIKDMSTGIMGSGGGTSHASPTTCGIIALIQSKAVENGASASEAVDTVKNIGNEGTSGRDGALQTETLKQIIQNTAKPPRRTQINSFGLIFSDKGYDARFGHGKIQVNEALKRV